MTLTKTLIEDILARMTYKPGSTFTVRESLYEWKVSGLEVIISIAVRDAENPTCATTLNGLEKFSAHDLETMTLERFKQRIYDRLVIMETHEVQEFLRYNGRRVVDPHPEMANHRRAMADYAKMMNDHLERSMKPIDPAKLKDPDKWFLPKQKALLPARNVGKQMAMADAVDAAKYTRKRYGVAEMYGLMDGVVVRYRSDGGLDKLIEEIVDMKIEAPKLEAAKHIPETRRKGYSSKPYERVRPRNPRR